jgi:hypothetical protein
MLKEVTLKTIRKTLQTLSKFKINQTSAIASIKTWFASKEHLSDKDAGKSSILGPISREIVRLKLKNLAEGILSPKDASQWASPWWAIYMDYEEEDFDAVIKHGLDNLYDADDCWEIDIPMFCKEDYNNWLAVFDRECLANPLTKQPELSKISLKKIPHELLRFTEKEKRDDFIFYTVTIPGNLYFKRIVNPFKIGIQLSNRMIHFYKKMNLNTKPLIIFSLDNQIYFPGLKKPVSIVAAAIKLARQSHRNDHFPEIIVSYWYSYEIIRNT